MYEHPDHARRISLLGGLRLEPATRLAVPARRVLVFLAVRALPQTRSTVAAGLWPDQPESTGRANLRRALWQLPTGWVTAAGDVLELDATSDLADAERVCARALNGQTIDHDDIRLLSRDLLPGWTEEWLAGPQAEFHQRRVHALEAACRALTGLTEYATAVVAGDAAVAAEPLRESAVEAVISAYLAQGNRLEALRRYRSVERMLRDELGVAPDGRLRAHMRGLT